MLCPLPSLQEMREAILAIYLDRKNLAATLKDTKTVVGKLEMIVGVVIQISFFFFYLIIWEVRSKSSLVPDPEPVCSTHKLYMDCIHKIYMLTIDVARCPEACTQALGRVLPQILAAVSVPCCSQGIGSKRRHALNFPDTYK